MLLTATPIYAAVAAFILIYLSLRVIRTRRMEKVALGDGGNAALLRASRAQANFAEYVPMALLLMGFAELQGAPLWAVHGLGLVLLAGRLVHAYGVSQAQENFRFRVRGMQLTFFVLAAAAILILVQAALPLI